MTQRVIASKRVGRQVGWMKPGLEARGHPTLLEIAWAAGLYEGEGSVVRKCEVSVSQKDRWVLEELQYLFGGSFSMDHRTGVTHWRLTGARARGFLMTIYTFLSPRRKEQAKRELLKQRQEHQEIAMKQATRLAA